jgi:tRNA 2-thiouridine synthesizing protein A
MVDNPLADTLENHADTVLDLSGLVCPLPVFKARKALQAMARGRRLTVIATDPMSMIDMPHFCTEQGHELLQAEANDGRFTFKIMRG